MEGKIINPLKAGIILWFLFYSCIPSVQNNVQNRHTGILNKCLFSDLKKKSTKIILEKTILFYRRNSISRIQNSELKLCFYTDLA